MKYKIADVVVEYEPQYEVLRERSQKYICKDEKQKIDFSIKVEESEIQRVIEEGEGFNVPIAEYWLTGIEFYRDLLDYNRVFIAFFECCDR